MQDFSGGNGLLYVTHYVLCTYLDDGDSFYETRKSLDNNCEISL